MVRTKIKQAQHELKVRLDALRLLQGCLVHRLLRDSHLSRFASQFFGSTDVTLS